MINYVNNAYDKVLKPCDAQRFSIITNSQETERLILAHRAGEPKAKGKLPALTYMGVFDKKKYGLEAEMIDATLYQDLIAQYKIERIPLLIVNDEKTFVGQKNMDEIDDSIVFEKEMHLGDVIKTGIAVEAKVTHELIGNVFFPNSPLHDGAAIIRDGRLLCAGCVLPLTKNNDEVSSDLGTRHRAAIGMSETTDAMVVVTSEETGTISIAHKGTLRRGFTEAELREVLLDYLIDSSPDKLSANKDSLKKLFKGWKK